MLAMSSHVETATHTLLMGIHNGYDDSLKEALDNKSVIGTLYLLNTANNNLHASTAGHPPSSL